jgi:glycosyltransferase involved in cell wall biosynthesis
MKKIIFFSVSGAGVKRNITDIALNLDREKYEVVGIFPDKLFSNVVHKASEYTYKEIFNKAGLKYHALEIPREFSMLTDAKAVVSLREILRDERPDVLHCHSSIAGALGRLAVAMLKSKPRIIYTPHLMYYQYVKGIKRSIYWSVEKFLWSFADAIVAVGLSEYGSLKRDFAPARGLYHINNGIDINAGISDIPDAKERLCNELNIENKSIIILSLARLEPQKDVITLLRAFILLANQHQDAVLLLAGGGTESQIKKAQMLIAEANLSKRRIFLLGWRDDPDLLISAADIAVLSTNFEGLPYALLEAMVAGKPLVGSRAQGVVDCIEDGHNGYLFDIGDTEFCAECLTRLLRDSNLRKRMGDSGREYVQREFALKDMLRTIEDLYEKLMHTTDM